jgi:2-succinyl-5-enolpyruvyl-6-hydroxy-3-cyclohexene-1-carboxylate synthase
VNRNLAWCGALFDELAHAGVRHVVVSPGSRSAPLALAAHADARLEDHSILDERAAAYFGLGLARATRAPVALVCTSGTAVANWLPAMIEAHHSRIPLVALSADRPPELRDCGAGQVIDQLKLFGAHVRWFHELPLPELDDALFRSVRSVAARAAALAAGGPPGPVHLNVPLREPLDATRVDDDVAALAELGELAREGRHNAALTRAAPAAPLAAAPDLIRAIAGRLRETERGWLAVGPCDDPGIAAAVSRLADALSWPVLAEPLSQLRCGEHASRWLVDTHDALLRCNRFVDAHAPELVLRFGDSLTSKAFRLALEARPQTTQLLVDPWGWGDPSALAAEIVRAEPVAFADAVCRELAAGPPQRGGFARSWIEAGQRARVALEAELDASIALDEPDVVRAVAEATPDDSIVYLASSSPVREADAFWPSGSRRLRFVANRGTNGIDGSVSCALGTAASGRPTVLLAGDLAVLHDASGWVAAARCAANLSIVVIDNDGGGIFEWLPAATSVERGAFERHLAAPQGIDLCAALRGFGLRCSEVARAKDLTDALREATARPGVDCIVVRTDRRRNAERLRELQQCVSVALSQD